MSDEHTKRATGPIVPVLPDSAVPDIRAAQREVQESLSAAQTALDRLGRLVGVGPEEGRHREEIETVAGVLRALENPHVGADRDNEGKYAVYFYARGEAGETDVVIRSLGQFDSPREAAEAVPYVQATWVVDALLQLWSCGADAA